MTTTIMFHEKCNDDIREILLDIKSRNDEETVTRRKQFLSRLIEAYQNLFEYNTGEPVFEIEKQWDKTYVVKSVHAIDDFPHLIITARLSNHTLVVLAVISKQSYYQVETDRRLEIFNRKP